MKFADKLPAKAKYLSAESKTTESREKLAKIESPPQKPTDTILTTSGCMCRRISTAEANKNDPAILHKNTAANWFSKSPNTPRRANAPSAPPTATARICVFWTYIKPNTVFAIFTAKTASKVPPQTDVHKKLR